MAKKRITGYQSQRMKLQIRAITIEINRKKKAFKYSNELKSYIS